MQFNLCLNPAWKLSVKSSKHSSIIHHFLTSAFSWLIYAILFFASCKNIKSRSLIDNFDVLLVVGVKKTVNILDTRVEKQWTMLTKHWNITENYTAKTRVEKQWGILMKHWNIVENTLQSKNTNYNDAFPLFQPVFSKHFHLRIFTETSKKIFLTRTLKASELWKGRRRRASEWSECEKTKKPQHISKAHTYSNYNLIWIHSLLSSHIRWDFFHLSPLALCSCIKIAFKWWDIMTIHEWK